MYLRSIDETSAHATEDGEYPFKLHVIWYWEPYGTSITVAICWFPVAHSWNKNITDNHENII
jgi:hypothetical protein